MISSGKSKIIFTNGKIIQGPEVADHAIGLILSFTRNLYKISKNIKIVKNRKTNRIKRQKSFSNWLRRNESVLQKD